MLYKLPRVMLLSSVAHELSMTGERKSEGLRAFAQSLSTAGLGFIAAACCFTR